MPWQCEVTDCRARTHRWGVPIAGEAVNLGGQETLGDSLCFLLKFAVNVKQLYLTKST